MSWAVKISPALLNFGRDSEKVVKESIEDCAADLLKTATQRTPYKKGGLEQSGRVTPVRGSGSNISSSVSFSVEGNNRYNYARKMNDDTYGLGAGSLRKNSGGVKSKFSKKAMRVGKGYLTDTAKNCEEGYTKYIQEQVIKSLR